MRRVVPRRLKSCHDNIATLQYNRYQQLMTVKGLDSLALVILRTKLAERNAVRLSLPSWAHASTRDYLDLRTVKQQH